MVLLLTGAVLFAAAVFGVMWAAGFGSVRAAFLHARWRWLVFVPIGVAISHLGYLLAYREITQPEDGPKLRNKDAAALVTAGFGTFNSRGGFALDANGLRRFGLNRSEAKLRVMLLSVAEYAVLAPAALAAALYMVLKSEPAQAGLLPSWIIGVPAGAAVILGLRALRGPLQRRSWWRPSMARGMEALDAAGSILRSWPQGPLTVTGMGLYWLGDVGALGAALAIFTPGRPTATAMILGYATGYALTRRTLPLGGAGAVEALLPFALSWISVPLAEAVLAVVTYRAFNLWLTELWASVGLSHLRKRAAMHPRSPRNLTDLLPGGTHRRHPTSNVPPDRQYAPWRRSMNPSSTR
jgi:uncharacterized membrane protein YbhN (UPF0104 family)